jgi:hypothetical protein
MEEGDGGDTAGETDIEEDGDKVTSGSLQHADQGEDSGAVEEGETLFDQAMAIPGNRLMMGITVVCLLSLILNYYLLFGRARSSETVIVPAPPREL